MPVHFFLRNHFVVFSLLISLVFCGASSLKANTENANLRPDPVGVATKVNIAIYVLDIEFIDNLKQHFTADFLVLARWHDERLAGDNRKESIEDIWFPNVEVLNGRDLNEIFPKNVDIDSDGNVLYRQRYYGNLACQLDLKKFPFDQQVFPITIVSFGFDPSEVELIFAHDQSGRMENLSCSDWKIGMGTGSTDVFKAYSSDKSRVEYERPVAQYKLKAERHIFFYIWKVIVPLFIIVLMSWAIFFIDPQQVGPQLGLAATSILTLIAFLFSLGKILPPIAYLTKIDYFVYSSLAMVFLAFGEAVYTIHLSSSGNLNGAKRLDKVSRIAFPLTYLVILLTFFLT
jgi:hypothetical protein